MPSFDWMTSASFQSEIVETVEAAAARQGMQRYEVAIGTRLQAYLDQNRPQRLTEELKKVTAAQRTKADALASVTFLVTEASKLAAADRRTTVTEADLQKAYAANYCRIWPFC